MRSLVAIVLLTGAMVIDPAQAQAQAPLSAIDWLSDSLQTPHQHELGAPVEGGLVTESISVDSLDAPSPDGVGLLPQSVTGLPANLWGTSKLDTLIRLISTFPTEPIPAVQDQFRHLMLAELEPPIGSTPQAPLLQARIDALLARGAVDEAEALLERAGSKEPELFRRHFDVSLLTGREQAACARMRAVPNISPSLPVRIFCLSRTGDWVAAALTLESAKALGQVSGDEDTLLAQFLDPELAEMLPPISLPRNPSPLTFRMMEAIGEAMPTAPLPLAFAHSDLRPIAGWKARIEAAERLVRAGALPDDVLFAAYGEQRPSASGGIWDRAHAVQQLEVALREKDVASIQQGLPDLWAQMHATGLAVAFSEAFGSQIAALDLTGASRNIALTAGLLSSDYETVAIDESGSDPDFALASAIARGSSSDTASGTIAESVAAAFEDATPQTPETFAQYTDTDRLGEGLLIALRDLANGASGDPSNLTAALTFLRGIGLEDTARRAALQILLLDPGA